MAGGTLYGATVWDPALIIAQIITVQCFFYTSLGYFYIFSSASSNPHTMLASTLLHVVNVRSFSSQQRLFAGPYVQKVALYHFFDWQGISFRSFTGWMLATANFCTAFGTAVALRYVVERAKKCLDFAATTYFFHLVVTSFYSGFPVEVPWWVVNGTGMAVAAVLGEWLCMHKEMQDIPLSSLRRPGRQASTGVPAATELAAVSVRS